MPPVLLAACTFARRSSNGMAGADSPEQTQAMTDVFGTSPGTIDVDLPNSSVWKQGVEAITGSQMFMVKKVEL